MTSKRITDLRLAEWKRLEGLATRGPWWVDGSYDPMDDTPRCICARTSFNAHPIYRLADVRPEGTEGPQQSHDARFIAAARQAVPALIAEVERLRELIERDQTGLAKALHDVLNRCRAGDWIAEGRGSYEWDDDRYRQETRIVLDDVMEIAQKALNESGTRVTQAMFPQLFLQEEP